MYVPFRSGNVSAGVGQQPTTMTEQTTADLDLMSSVNNIDERSN